MKLDLVNVTPQRGFELKKGRGLEQPRNNNNMEAMREHLNPIYSAP
ncbi:hypothetical protein [Vibrio aphrogenes]|nr:hypothetical protein [Vibrio aphrogenes]